jgi:hypothetical protein
MQITLSLLVFHIQIALDSHSFASINIHTPMFPEQCVYARVTMSRSWLLVDDIERGAWAGSTNSVSRAVVGDDAGSGAVREDRTTPITWHFFPRRSTRETENPNERANTGTGDGGIRVVVLMM